MGNTELMLDMGNTEFKFKGVFNALPETANVGDVVMVSGETYVYGDDWQEIGNAENKEPPKNCPNCGGVINPYKLKCEFCGTYW